MSTGENPIRSVDGKSIPCPSSYVYKLEDLSASDAGRTEDAKMHKKRRGQLVSLELAWQNLKTAEVSLILNAFDTEYITVEYLDARASGYRTSEFYVDSKSTPMYNAAKGLWSGVTFGIVERQVKDSV